MDADLAAIASDIHSHFHQWMGGSQVSCTIEDMEKYIEEFSNSSFDKADAEQATSVAIKLSGAKKLLRSLL